MRTQYCREHIDTTAEACGLDEDTVTTVKKDAEFCEQYPHMCAMASRPIRVIRRISDKNLRDKVISHVENTLKRKTPTGGNYTDRLTEGDVRTIIETVKREMIEEASVTPEMASDIVQPNPSPTVIFYPDESGVSIIPPQEITTIPISQTLQQTIVEPEELLPNVIAPLPPNEPVSKSVFNRTNDNIEWAKWSWNPVTGCKMGCQYCYARDIANRFYTEKFEPTFHPERLSAPFNTKIPAITTDGERTVFVCSMADLFGDWVPQEWIDAVIDVVRASPEWIYIFLTKNPKRLATIKFPDNAWVGTTVDIQARVKPAEDAFKKVNASVKFLSIEPFMEHLEFKRLDLFDWIIIGGRSRSSGMDAGQPEWDWVEYLLLSARDANLKVYFKPNLAARPKEMPDI